MKPLNHTIAALLLLALTTAAPATFADDAYPDRTIQVFVGAAAGGSSDVVTRTIGERLSKRLKQPVIVVNRPGANTRIGSQSVMQSKPDGYSLGLMYAQSSIFHLMFDGQEPLVPGKDFTPIAKLAKAPSFIAVPANSPAKTLPELMKLKGEKGLTFGHAGAGGKPVLAIYSVLKKYGVEATPVPYKGGAPMAAALIAGEVDFAPLDMTSAKPLVEGARIRLLALLDEKRSPLAPEVPSTGEFGVPNTIDGSPWYMLAGPAGLSPEKANLLNNHVLQILQEPDMKEMFLKLGLEAESLTPTAAAAFYESERLKLSDAVKGASLQLK